MAELFFAGALFTAVYFAVKIFFGCLMLVAALASWLMERISAD